MVPFSIEEVVRQASSHVTCLIQLVLFPDPMQRILAFFWKMTIEMIPLLSSFSLIQDQFYPSCSFYE